MAGRRMQEAVLDNQSREREGVADEYLDHTAHGRFPLKGLAHKNGSRFSKRNCSNDISYVRLIQINHYNY